MKIVMVHDQFLSEEHGIYAHTHYLSKELIKKPEIEQLDIITPITCSTDNQQTNTTSHSDFSDIFLIPKKLKKKINELKPDIVHIHGTHPPYSLLPGMLKGNHRILLTLHGIVAIDSKNSIRNRLLLKNYIFSYLEKNAVRKSDEIIAVSPPIKDIIIKMGGDPSKITIVPNGINIEDYNDIEELDGIFHPSLFYIGRLVKGKGIDILINALPMIKESICDIHLYIAGSGPQYKKLKQLIEVLGLSDNITFLGYLHGKEKLSYFKSTDICILPSTFEALPIVILEAMASGKPVVGSNVGGIPFLINDGETGFLFKSEDYRDLAEKISELLINKELIKRMGLSSRKRAEKFTWSCVADSTVEVYKKMLMG